MVKVNSTVHHFVRNSELVNLQLNSPMCKLPPGNITAMSDIILLLLSQVTFSKNSVND